MIQIAAVALAALSVNAAGGINRERQLINWQKAWDKCKNSPDTSIDRNTCIKQHQWLYNMNNTIYNYGSHLDVHGVDYLFDECFHENFDPKDPLDLECVEEKYEEWMEEEMFKALDDINFD